MYKGTLLRIVTQSLTGHLDRPEVEHLGVYWESSGRYIPIQDSCIAYYFKQA